ncbi:Transcription initiation factor TFIID subunit [Zostera marina]|uniref:Transcription initiation factor TFIID subunit n=1 Tax=Zostera marina TaxID=29655 RepID=A0A0K9NN68_ZOSMR|nr:Transcription initiation factor TFIID subunit [Zostera marina]
MEEQFILRVPPSIAEHIEKLLNEDTSPSTSEANSLDLSFSDDGRNGSFMMGDKHFPASLVDLPCVVESYKTYDDQTLIKTADVGQMILVREEGDSAPEGMEYRHGLTPPMRDVRRRRFRREPDLNPELVQRVEKDLVAARTSTETSARVQNTPKPAPTPTPKVNTFVPGVNPTTGEDRERSDSDDSDESMDIEN